MQIPMKKPKVQKLKGMKRIAAITERLSNIIAELEQGKGECEDAVCDRQATIVEVEKEIRALDEAACQAEGLIKFLRQAVQPSKGQKANV